MSKIEHKYDVGDVVLIPMRVSGVSSTCNGDRAVYALSPIGGRLNAFVGTRGNYVVVNNENYIYSEFKGEVPMPRIEEVPMSSSVIDTLKDRPFGTLEEG